MTTYIENLLIVYAVTGKIKYNNQMMFTCPFIVDRLDCAMHSSQRGMIDDQASMADSRSLERSLDTSARVACQRRTGRERRKAS